MILNVELYHFEGKFFHFGVQISENEYITLKEMLNRVKQYKQELDKPLSQSDPIAFASKFRPRNSNYI